MSDNNGWPGKPGVPLNPEKTGWHWLSGALERPAAFEWLAHKQAWLFHRAQPEDQAMAPPAFGSWTYLGPCLTPAEVESHKHAAVIAYANLLNLPAPPNLIAQARRDALEEAAQEMDCACPQRGAVLAKLAKDGPLSHHWPCKKSDDCCALRGAAIRALKGEGDE